MLIDKFLELWSPDISILTLLSFGVEILQATNDLIWKKK